MTTRMEAAYRVRQARRFNSGPSLFILIERIMPDNSWWAYDYPTHISPIAEGTCTTLKDGKKQVKDKLIELGIMEKTDE